MTEVNTTLFFLLRTCSQLCCILRWLRSLLQVATLDVETAAVEILAITMQVSMEKLCFSWLHFGSVWVFNTTQWHG